MEARQLRSLQSRPHYTEKHYTDIQCPHVIDTFVVQIPTVVNFFIHNFCSFGRAKEREIQGLGRWTYAQFDMSYLTTLPTKALIIQSGFTKDWMDRRPLSQVYVIARSRVRPPEELIQMVFPWLDGALAAIKKVLIRILQSLKSADSSVECLCSLTCWQS